MKTGIDNTVGKTINGVVIAENNRPPNQQILLTFTNGYFLELWGSDIHSAGGLDKGSLEEAIRYADRNGATVKRICTKPVEEVCPSLETTRKEPERAILKILADKIALRITKKSIAELQKIKSTLSGEDTPLKNAWDEICVQIQGEESLFWEVYKETVNQIIRFYISKIEPYERNALWLQTDAAIDWMYDYDTDDEPPASEDDIVEYIFNEFIYKKADEYTNHRIRKFLDS